MKKLTTALGALAFAAVSNVAMADPVDDTLVLNEETTMVTRTAAPAHMSDVVDEVYSGWHFRGTETRAMQADDFDNPGMIFVEQAEDSWNLVEGSEGKACASCHEGSDSMAGVRPVYPKWNEAAGEVRTLEMQINDCRETQMGAEAWGWNSGPMVNMTALISSVSRGLPISVAVDGPAADTYEMGKELYYTRTGQLELSCANCHEDNYGVEERQAELDPRAFQGLRARHKGGDVCGGVAGVYST